MKYIWSGYLLSWLFEEFYLKNSWLFCRLCKPLAQWFRWRGSEQFILWVSHCVSSCQWGCLKSSYRWVWRSICCTQYVLHLSRIFYLPSIDTSTRDCQINVSSEQHTVGILLMKVLILMIEVVSECSDISCSFLLSKCKATRFQMALWDVLLLSVWSAFHRECVHMLGLCGSITKWCSHLLHLVPAVFVKGQCKKKGQRLCNKY